ncbi:MAG: hypothetical protein SCARUB_03678 [Candidatus Scalindua rubra]|uniref:Uncharacterized protein n=1 Tax=Candidatus Scalindua rubra TaxID=1872076 RepID=A0A1E3X6F9_9BACT|nr:MAG: hypothetical protein SCARUB_03678 [Candidatus Scalindua rubra]
MCNPVSRHYVHLDAINPIDGKKFSVKVNRKRMQIVARRGKGHVYEMAYVLPEVLMKPKAIFEGLRIDEEEPKDDIIGWHCYVGKPSKAFRSNGQQMEAWPDQVYLVFVNEENVVYNWRWEKADSRDLDMPKEYDKRFRKRVL